MNWQKLLSDQRYYSSDKKQENYRSEFQRDFDRIVFSNAFRRLQGKTQVFPMPDNDVIHNRLTHSLEVSCVGRSIGTKVGFELIQAFNQPFGEKINQHDIGAIVASSCLVHDIGNPPFGHNGERIIQNYFKDNPKWLKNLSLQEKNDFLRFDGNALGLRLLKNKKDFNLTYATLASFIKYPITSDLCLDNPSYAGFKKPGVFKSEMDFFNTIVKKTALIEAEEKTNLAFYRHPLNFLVEAADDICYHLIDLEDAYRSKIISFNQMQSQLIRFIPKREKNRMPISISSAKLRAMAINHLVVQVCNIFLAQYDQIINQPEKINQSLIESIDEIECFMALKKFSKQAIYQKQKILKKEYNAKKIITSLLDYYLHFVFNSNHSEIERQIRHHPNLALPQEYQTEGGDDYEKIIRIVEYIASMTDRFALKVGNKTSSLAAKQAINPLAKIN